VLKALRREEIQDESVADEKNFLRTVDACHCRLPIDAFANVEIAGLGGTSFSLPRVEEFYFGPKIGEGPGQSGLSIEFGNSN
jgi:hypothetical protein